VRIIKTVCVALGVAGLAGLALLRPTFVRANPVPAAKQVLGPTSAPPSAPPIALDAGSAQPEPTPTTATIVFATTPATTATVTWGRKLLGKITPGDPLVVVRPRDSGPLDVMVRATGYLSVQTRAHTFSDTRVQVKLTPVENISEVLGYRVPLDGGLDGGAPEGGLTWDGGVPGDAGAVPLTAPDATLFQTVPTAPAATPWLIQ